LILTFDLGSYFSTMTRHRLCERYRLATQQMLWRRVQVSQTGGVGCVFDQGWILLVGGLGPSLLRWDWETATTLWL